MDIREKEKKLIDYLFNLMKNTVLENFDESEKEEIQKAYKDYLVREYALSNSEYFLKNELDPKLKKKEIKFWNEMDRKYEKIDLLSKKELYLEEEKSFWEKKPPDFIRAYLIWDENYRGLVALSNQLKSEAIYRANTFFLFKKKNLRNREQTIAELKELYENVEQDYNKFHAKQHYGDALMDLDFALELSDCCSLYVSHYI